MASSLTRLLWLLAAIGAVAPALAVEPVTTISFGTLVTILGMLVSLTKIFIDVAVYTFCLALFFGIVFVLGANVFAFLRNFGILNLINEYLLRYQGCSLLNPSDIPGT
jgi:hypothetical protein